MTFLKFLIITRESWYLQVLRTNQSLSCLGGIQGRIAIKFWEFGIISYDNSAKKYLDSLVSGIGNGLVKILTGGRRTGKSFLLFTLFRNYLLENVTDEKHIIGLSFDDLRNRNYRDPIKLLDYIDSDAANDGETIFINGRRRDVRRLEFWV